MRIEGSHGAALLAASLAPVVAGLAASSALLVDYLRPVPLFCAEGGGCESLRSTPLAYPLGAPMPAFGVAGFAAIGVAALVAGKGARLVQLVLGSVAALVGLALFTVQAALGRFCPFCLVADVSGIAGFFAAWLRLSRSAGTVAPSWARASAAGLLFVSAGAAPFAALVHRSPPTPAVIVAEWKRAPKGVATIVDFVDFECPFCRMTNAELEPLVEEHQKSLYLVRRHVPLRSHAHSMPAARAAVCGEVLGRGDAMASALFKAPVDDLTPEGCETIAQSVGIAPDAYRACIADPKTDERIEHDRTEFVEAGGRALPTIWIGRQELVGSQTREALARAIEAAIARAGG